jgi:hypothetical protein
MDAHQALIAVSALGGCLALRKSIRRRRCLFVAHADVALLACACLGIAAAIGYHAAHTWLAYGTLASNSWYAAIAFPWLICLLYQGFALLPGRRTAPVLALCMAMLYLAAEFCGVFAQMIPAYTDQPWSALARTRLAEMHPAGFGPALTLSAAGAALLLIVLALSVALRRPTHAPQPDSPALDAAKQCQEGRSARL